MAAFNSFDFTNATPTANTYAYRATTYGIAGLGMLYTAYYSAPNTLTLQFSSYDPAVLVAASSTTSKYTIAGPSAPTVTAVSFTPGGRTLTLTLSGALISTNTYTLAIADNTVSNGEQGNFSGLIVDIILPTTLDTIGSGVDQIISLGTPSAQNAGTAQEVGIQQDITLGTPASTSSVSTVGVGVNQQVLIGTPSAGLFSTITGVGLSQVISFGTPTVGVQQQPLGVGIQQDVLLGTPGATINPLTPTEVGVSQIIVVGTPNASGPAPIVGLGFNQIVSFGTPVAVRVLDRLISGISVVQDVLLGTPTAERTFPPAINIAGSISGSAAVSGTLTTQPLALRLQISSSQAAILGAFDDYFNQACSYGVQVPGFPPIPVDPALLYYFDSLTEVERRGVRRSFNLVTAAVLKQTNIQNPIGTATTGSVSTKAGNLVFVNGILTTYTPV